MLLTLLACTFVDLEPLVEEAPLGRELWVLIHPTDAPAAGPGIVALDASGVEIARLPLPPGVTSPHGLTFDGSSLWMSDYGDDRGPIYELDPTDGAVLSVIEGWRTEGIALDGDGFWVGGGEVSRIDRSGVETDRRPGLSTVQDVAFDGVDVYLLTNGGQDFVTRIAPDGTHHELPNAVTRDNTGYAMVWADGELLVADTETSEDDPYGIRVIRHVDPTSGAIVATSDLPVEGWVTALAVAP